MPNRSSIALQSNDETRTGARSAPLTKQQLLASARATTPPPDEGGNELAQLRQRTVGTEKFYSIKDAAELLGLRYWHLQRAVKRGLVPSHRLLTTKRLVRLSEVTEAIERSRSGGQA